MDIGANPGDMPDFYIAFGYIDEALPEGDEIDDTTPEMTPPDGYGERGAGAAGDGSERPPAALGNDNPTGEAAESSALVHEATLTRARQLVETYPDIKGLVNCTTYASPVKPETVAEDSAGRRLLPDMQPMQLVELNRTISAVLTFDDAAAGDYETLTAGQTADRLSPEKFDGLHRLTGLYAPAGLPRDAVRTHLAINDNGKRDDWMAAAAAITGHFEGDHDKVLHTVLTHRPEMSPAFMALPAEGRQTILDTLEAGVNLGQLSQGEASIDSLQGLTALRHRPELFRHAVVEWAFDVGGARGHETQRGSLTLTEKFTSDIEMVVDAFESVGPDVPDEQFPAEVYRGYLQRRAEAVGLAFNTDEDVAITRMACMADIRTAERAGVVADTIRDSLGSSSRTILTRRLGALERGDPVVYYAPKLVRNLIGALEAQGDPEALRNGILIGAGTLAQTNSVYARQRALGAEAMEQIMASQISRISGISPETLLGGRLELAGEGGAVMAGMKPEHNVNLSNLQRLDSLAELPGKTFVGIGIGGGSDVVSTAVAAETAEVEGGKTCLGVVSIRTTLGGRREVLNPLRDLGSGVYVAGPDTRMNIGRYHEDLVAATGRPTLIIMKDAAIPLDSQLETALSHLGSSGPIDTIFNFDTGGDAHTPASQGSPSDSAVHENQDRVNLEAVQRVGPRHARHLLVETGGLGIDSPQGAGDMMEEAGTRYFSLSARVKADMVARFARMGLPSNTPTRFAKTLPAFVRALEGARGLVEVELPPERLLDPVDPWNPFTYVDEMSSILFFTPLDAHLAVIDR